MIIESKPCASSAAQKPEGPTFPQRFYTPEDKSSLSIETSAAISFT